MLSTTEAPIIEKVQELVELAVELAEVMEETVGQEEAKTIKMKIRKMYRNLRR
jgi:hypothetical protein